MEEVRQLRALLRDANSIDIYALARSFEYSSKMNKRYKVSFVALISKRDPIILFNEWKHNEFSFNIDGYHNFYEIKELFQDQTSLTAREMSKDLSVFFNIKIRIYG
jgi:hypothetical protein